MPVINYEVEGENRIMAVMPILDITNLDPFPDEFEEYFNDNFSFRTPFINFHQYLKFEVFGISPDPEKVIIGNEGWFFMAREEVKIYKGLKHFNSLELQQFASVWDKRVTYFNANNIPCYWMIAPMKLHVYEEHLPFNIYKLKKETRVEELTNFLNVESPGLIIDLRSKLLEAKARQKLYYKHDNHWNYRAGFVAYKSFMEQLANEFDSLDPIDTSDFVWIDSVVYGGTHAQVLGYNDEMSEMDWRPQFHESGSMAVEKYGFLPPERFGKDVYEQRFRSSHPKSKLRILVIRDSYADLPKPFFKESFEESVFIFDAWKYGFDLEIIEKVDPDVVLYIGLETHVANYLSE